MKTVYVSWLYHGNMSYDRYTKHTIRAKFPAVYQIMIDEFMANPDLQAQVELSGLTVNSLLRWSPEIIEQLRVLVERGQVEFLASYYAAPVNACMDGNTNLGALALGTKIVTRHCGAVAGLFCQENSYTPQLPWAMSQLGLKWLVVPRKTDHDQPFILNGHDGTQVYGVPLSKSRDGYETLLRGADDGSLWLFGFDYEMYHSLLPVKELIRKLADEGINVVFTRVTDYLQNHPPTTQAYYQVYRDPHEQACSRWVSDPEDIRTHAVTVEAMQALRAAEIVSGTALHHFGEIEGLAQAEGKLDSDPRTFDIEQPEEFPDVETDYLADESIPALSKAKHLLYWGVNSDARGWYPLTERRWEHRNAMLRSTAHSNAVTQTVMRHIGKHVAAPAGCHTYLLFNPTGARSAWLRLTAETPHLVRDAENRPLPSFARQTAHGYEIWVKAALPEYGYTLIHLVVGGKNDHDIPVLGWQPGNAISNGAFTLTHSNGTVSISANQASYSLSLHAPTIWRELTQKTGLVSREFTGVKNGSARIWQSDYPHMQIHTELAFGVHLLQEYMLVEDGIRCCWRFDFAQPYLIGPENKFRAEGLTAMLQASAGSVFYDAGYGVIKHLEQTSGYLAALHFAGLQQQTGGVVLTSLTGTQSYFSDAGNGRIGMGLGTSTQLGPCVNPDTMLVDAERKDVKHFWEFDEALFCGTYEHRFTLSFYSGHWQQNNITAQALNENIPVICRQLFSGEATSPALPATQSLLHVTPATIVVQSAKHVDGKLRVLLNEPNGVETPCVIKSKNNSWSGVLPPGALQYKEL